MRDTATETRWALALAAVAILGSLATACMTPLIAIATIAAFTLPRPAAFVATLGCWAASQAIGFGLLGYPVTAYAIGWGLAIGGAALLGCAVAQAIRRGETLAIGRALIALAAAFAADEIALFLFADVAGGLDTFTPAIIAKLAANEALWFAILLGAAFLLRTTLPRTFGRQRFALA